MKDNIRMRIAKILTAEEVLSKILLKLNSYPANIFCLKVPEAISKKTQKGSLLENNYTLVKCEPYQG